MRNIQWNIFEGIIVQNKNPVGGKNKIRHGSFLVVTMWREVLRFLVSFGLLFANNQKTRSESKQLKILDFSRCSDVTLSK